MSTKVGLWIDHRKALIMAVTDRGEATRLVISKIDKQLGRSGGARSTTPYESQQVPADDSRETKIHWTSQHLLRCGDCEHSA